MAGFSLFLGLEQFLHWHHCHRGAAECKEPLTHLILLGDGLHNFLGGLGVGGVMLLDVRLGFAAWLAAAAHEVPQELGDFAILIHGGWPRRRALLFNLLSGLTFLVGALVAYAASDQFDVTLLVPFAAGNFIYIGASDLVPEVNRHSKATVNLIHYVSFVSGVTLLWGLRLVLGPEGCAAAEDRLSRRIRTSRFVGSEGRNSMSMSLEEALKEAIDDEYRARATYRAVLDAYGDVRPFVNIVESEERHIGALGRLFERYGFEVPEDPWPSRVSAPNHWRPLVRLESRPRSRTGRSTNA